MKVVFPAGEVSRIQSWPHGIKLAHWRDHNIVSNDKYNYEWIKIFRGLNLDPDCNVVDIGAQIGWYYSFSMFGD